ncbi:MAG: aminoacetone oxidase family FAD-binding enzyme [Lachnospiraceae bacterium]|nr:aminoacetone oxidase family FAD-binding enzyme [Lachnospiraceae bacterium]
MNVIVIGAGASGLVAAIEAAKANNKVTVLELKNEAGKKIYATGNGRCNLTNKNIDKRYYHCDDYEWLNSILNRYGYDKIKEYFENLGLFLTEIGDYVYPHSKQASSVVELLFRECEQLKVEFVYNCNVKRITKAIDKFEIEANITKDKNTYKTKYNCDRIIVAAGGKASPKLGSDGSGYYLLGKLGHTVNDVVPALVPLICEDFHNGKNLKEMQGVRCNAVIKSYYEKICDENFMEESCGELQMTDYGISGIVVFQLSAQIGHRLSLGKKVYVSIDFMPEFSEEKLYQSFTNHLNMCRKRNIDYEPDDNESFIYSKEIIDSFLKVNINIKLAGVIISMVSNTIPNDISEYIKDIIYNIKNFELEVTGSKGFENAQVSSGGITLKEVDENMQSKLAEGLYIAGEVLDVDGICGGYNLHFAFASGIIAGKLL